eukprot:COSAG01_NODE_2700_length_7232_cov_3.028876_10_plen_41_part_00
MCDKNSAADITTQMERIGHGSRREVTHHLKVLYQFLSFLA